MQLAASGDLRMISWETSDGSVHLYRGYANGWWETPLPNLTDVIRRPRLAIGGDGAPWLASGAHLWRWEGAAWAEIGAEGMERCDDPALAQFRKGVLRACLTRDALVLSAATREGLTPVGPPLTTDGAYKVSMATDGERVMVAWPDNRGRGDRFALLDGANWVTLPSPGIHVDGRDPVAFYWPRGGEPLVGLLDRTEFIDPVGVLLRYADGAWEPVPAPFTPGRVVQAIALADAGGGRARIAWVEEPRFDERSTLDGGVLEVAQGNERGWDAAASLPGLSAPGIRLQVGDGAAATLAWLPATSAHPRIGVASLVGEALVTERAESSGSVGGPAVWPAIACGTAAPVVGWVAREGEAMQAALQVHVTSGGEALPSPGSTTDVEVAVGVGAGGAPVAAWVQPVAPDASVLARRYGGSSPLVARWSGGEWVGYGPSAEVAGLGSGAGAARSVALAVDERERPVIAWAQATPLGADEIYLRAWDGAAWQDLGGSAAPGEWGGGVSDTPAQSRFPVVVLDRAGRPVVAWTEGGSTFQGPWAVRVERWDGGRWVDLAVPRGACEAPWQGSGSAASPAPVALALDPDDRPVLAWSTVVKQQRTLEVCAWDGSAWHPYPKPPVVAPLGWGAPDWARGPRSEDTPPPMPRLSAFPGGLLLAWQGEVGPAWSTGLARWDGATWTPGQGLSSPEGLQMPALCSIGTRACLAAVEGGTDGVVSRCGEVAGR